jgi:A/G-specific adenine glycosylase
MPSLDATEAANRLLAWYAAEGRDLPWRHTRDPYALLVAEVMLQQTQVERIVPRWQAWLERWPTVEALAGAPAAEVVVAWRGLGYNRRAVNLHRAARAIAAAGWPATADGLRALPGIGPYTAAALAAQAFGADVVPVDVNVRRVLERSLGAVEIAPPPGRASELTQALFDLGATVCLARVPRCGGCPLADACPSRGRRYEPARRQTAFEGSRRQARGRLLDAVRAGPVPLATVDEAVARELERDGLVALHGDVVTLPSA